MGKYIPVDPEKWAAMVQAQAENKRLKENLNSVTETHRINTSMWKDDLVRYKEICDELDAECTRLKAEVERLTSDIQMEKENEDRLVREWQKANNEVYGLKTQVAALIDDQTRLKAEVERLTKERDKALTDFWYIHEGYFRLQAEVNRLTAFTTRTIIPNEELQAQVERLTKAGDAMALEIINAETTASAWLPKVVRDWNAAKEGKQP